MRDQPGEQTAPLSFVTIELSSFQPGTHGSMENAVVSAGCNVSSGAASTFYLGSARGAASPRHRGWLRLMLMLPLAWLTVPHSWGDTSWLPLWRWEQASPW